VKDGILLKDEAMDKLEVSGATFLKAMRDKAREICKLNGTVNSDDLRKFAETWGIVPPSKYHWGNVFSPKEFVYAGTVRSKRPSNHARRIIKWKLKKRR